MMLKITNEKIVTDIEGLRKLSKKQLPIKASYAIAKNICKLKSELKVYNKEKEKLIKEYAEFDCDGIIVADEEGNIVFKEGCKERWDKDIKELLAIENEIDIHRFSIDILEGQDMTPAEIMLIEYMIEE